MKIRVLHEFKDVQNNLKIRTVGETMTVAKDRADYLVSMKVAEIISEEGGDPESPSETQG